MAVTPKQRINELRNSLKCALSASERQAVESELYRLESDRDGLAQAALVALVISPNTDAVRSIIGFAGHGDNDVAARVARASFALADAMMAEGAK